MSSPLIGITTRKYTGIALDIRWILSPRSYTEAVIRSGGIPILIPLNLPKVKIHDLLDKLDGVIFSGGGDVGIEQFGGEPHEKVYGVDEERDFAELFLMDKVVELEIPFLAICRGIQIMNIGFGGTLHTHILDQKEGALDHSHDKEKDFAFKAHSVQLVEGSRIKKIIGKTNIEVNSFHHQGIELVSSDLKISGVAEDDLVESLEYPGHPFAIGVQWHPEWMPEEEDQQKLFSVLIDAAHERAKKNGK